MADKIVSWGGFDSKGTSGMDITGSVAITGSTLTIQSAAPEIRLVGSTTNVGTKGIYFYHSSRAAWVESPSGGAGDSGGLTLGAWGQTFMTANGTYNSFNSVIFSYPVSSTEFMGASVNSGTHYYSFNNGEKALRIASTRLGSYGRQNLKIMLRTALSGTDAGDADTFFYVPGTNKNISINSTTTDLGAQLGVRGSGTTSSSTSLLVQNANSSGSLVIRDGTTLGGNNNSSNIKVLTDVNDFYGNYVYPNLTGKLYSLGVGGNLAVGAAGAQSYSSSFLDFNVGYYDNGQGQQQPRAGFITATGTKPHGEALDGRLILGTYRYQYGNAITQSSTLFVYSGSVGIGVNSPSASLHVAGNTIITGSLSIGLNTTGFLESTVAVGPPPAGGTGEGGQILLAAAGGTYTSASMLDNYQNSFRLLRGTNAGSDGYKFKVDLHSGQVQIPNYNGPAAFTGAPVANLSVDTTGNVLTSAGYTGTVTIVTNPPGQQNLDFQNGILVNVF